MLIRVRYRDNSYDMLKAWRLQEYLETGRIDAFYRSGTWVSVGRDPVRDGRRRDYHGPERRRQGNAQ
jgi:hypothetical protein